MGYLNFDNYRNHQAREQEWKPRCRVGRSTDQTLTTGVQTPISFNVERWDTADMWAVGAPTKVYCKIPGHYVLMANVMFDKNATRNRRLQIRLNGTTIIGDSNLPNNTVNDNLDPPLTTDWVMVEGDYVELIAVQNSGGDLAIKSMEAYSPELSMFLS